MNNPESGELSELLADITENRKKELESQKNNGRMIAGYFCLYTPVELLEACGAVPIRIMKNGTHAHETQGGKFIRSDSCSFCKASLGYLQGNNSFSCIVSGTTCDQMRRIHEIIGNKLKIPVFLFANPRTCGSAAAIELFSREMHWITDEITQLTGEKFTESALAERIEAWNKLRRFLKRIHEMRKLESPPLSGSEMFDIINAAFYLGPEDFLKHSDRIEKLIKNSEPASDNPPMRIFLTGSILTQGDRILLELIEENRKGVVVSDLMCSGVRWFYNTVDTGNNALQSISRHYHLNTFCPHRRPNDPLFDFAREQIDSMKPAGIVHRTLEFCHPWSFEVKTLKESFNIPLLHIDTDYSNANTGQLRTRIQAFLEMLKSITIKNQRENNN